MICSNQFLIHNSQVQIYFSVIVSSPRRCGFLIGNCKRWLGLQHEAGGGEDWQQNMDMVSDYLEIPPIRFKRDLEVIIAENSVFKIGQAQNLGCRPERSP